VSIVITGELIFFNINGMKISRMIVRLDLSCVLLAHKLLIDALVYTSAADASHYPTIPRHGHTRLKN